MHPNAVIRAFPISWHFNSILSHSTSVLNGGSTFLFFTFSQSIFRKKGCFLISFGSLNLSEGSRINNYKCWYDFLHRFTLEQRSTAFFEVTFDKSISRTIIFSATSTLLDNSMKFRNPIYLQHKKDAKQSIINIP